MNASPTNESLANWLEGRARELDGGDGFEHIYAKGFLSLARILQVSPPVDSQDRADLALFLGLAHSCLLNEGE